MELWQRDAGSAAYHTSAAIHLRGSPVVRALHNAFAMVVRRQMVGLPPDLLLTGSTPQKDDLSDFYYTSTAFQDWTNMSDHVFLLQILRCQFVPAAADGTAFQRLRDEVDVIEAFGIDGIAGGAKNLTLQPDGIMLVAPNSPLHNAWSAILSTPFDLYRDPLIRLRVRT